MSFPDEHPQVMKSTSAATVGAKKAVPRVALVGLDEATSAVLSDCFRQFDIQTVSLSGNVGLKLQKEKFEAMVVRLDEHADKLFEAARTSPSNRRIVIYAVAPGPRQALRHSRFGINAVLDEPIERQAVLRIVRATHLLVVHELRRYVRIPVVTQVALDAGNRNVKAQSQEISGGGMSFRAAAKVTVGTTVEASFDLPGKAGIKVRATICWARDLDGMSGLRFDPEDERRLRVKEWIDDYLGI